MTGRLRAIKGTHLFSTKNPPRSWGCKRVDWLGYITLFSIGLMLAVLIGGAVLAALGVIP